MDTNDRLRDACAFWQEGRDESSAVRAAARILTRRTQYFSANFIDQYEANARKDPLVLSHARTLLRALATGPVRDPAGWSATLGVGAGWVGRGIKSAEQDQQILNSLDTGILDMPLWGASLDADVPATFGRGFLFVIEGRFPAVPAWLHSGKKAGESELIVGGRYQVEPRIIRGETVVVPLRFESLIAPLS